MHARLLIVVIIISPALFSPDFVDLPSVRLIRLRIRRSSKESLQDISSQLARADSLLNALGTGAAAHDDVRVDGLFSLCSLRGSLSVRSKGEGVEQWLE
jgi:hypothetical protein